MLVRSPWCARRHFFSPTQVYLKKTRATRIPECLSIFAKRPSVKYVTTLSMVDGTNNRVVKLDMEGKILGTLGSFGEGTRQVRRRAPYQRRLGGIDLRG